MFTLGKSGVGLAKFSHEATILSEIRSLLSPKTMLTEINLNLGVEIPPVETVELSYILLKFSIYRVEIESLGRTVADTLL